MFLLIDINNQKYNYFIWVLQFYIYIGLLLGLSSNKLWDYVEISRSSTIT